MPQDIPCTYRGEPHPELPFDSDCGHCSLGKTRQYRNTKAREGREEWAVGSAGPDLLTDIKLIILSDHPGPYEALRGYPMVDNRDIKRVEESSPKYRRNAGALMRQALQEMYGLNSYRDVLFINVVRCNPGPTSIIESKHTKPCVGRWTRPEFTVIDMQIPEVPILIAGRHAFASIKYMWPTEWKELKKLGLNNCRRRKDIRLGSHPSVFSYNPAAYARGEAKIETQGRLSRGRRVVTETKWWSPALPGSPIWFFINDLAYLQFFLET